MLKAKFTYNEWSKSHRQKVQLNRKMHKEIKMSPPPLTSFPHLLFSSIKLENKTTDMFV